MTKWHISSLDQVTSLTRGLSLPLPPIDRSALEVILEAVASAWEQVQHEHMHCLVMGKEAEISGLLINYMNEALSQDDDGGLGMYVSSVARGSEQVNFNGEKLELRPDIQFVLTTQDVRFRLVAECKIIDLAEQKTPAKYRDEGIRRFVVGDYAWASQEALMFAYVRCKTSKLNASVLTGLQTYADMNCTAQSMRLSNSALITNDAMGSSSHDRHFQYMHTPTPASPGPIELWHLWLAV